MTTTGKPSTVGMPTFVGCWQRSSWLGQIAQQYASKYLFRLYRTVTSLLSEDHRHACSLVALDKERHTEHVVDTWCKTTCITLRTLSTVFTVTASLDPCLALLRHFTEAQLYTDGSAFKEGLVEDFLYGKVLTRATGAIFGTDDGDNYTATRVDFTTTKLTPFLTELVATIYARRRSTADIASNCQGSLKDAPPSSHGTPTQRPHHYGLRLSNDP